jgi:uncharacterized protein DUF6600/FecR-like protein
MLHHTLVRSILFTLILTLLIGVYPAAADSSHVRIVRLSLIQGDVRFTRDAQGDPLSDQKAAWETAVLNLPIRQGYVIATGSGRAEIEFENGAMAFLGENTTIEFYDLSRDDSSVSSRLILRQGTASFYVHPAAGDYFSVTGGDFTVEATTRASFRIDSYDDGSAVSVSQGHIAVLHKEQTSRVDKGQSLSMHAGDSDAVDIGRAGDDDDFDTWVSGRVDSVATQTNASMQYVSSPYYSSGFADLNSYGSWYSIGGFGNCWRPFGAGFGWSPFDSGSWFFDPVFGWTLIGFQPWGWTPYHYGSWIFSPAYGWVWVPSGFGVGHPVRWHPVTGVFLRAGNKTVIVPSHPADAHGKTPINIAHGVMPVTERGVAAPVMTAAGEKWKVLKAPPRNTLTTQVTAVTPPARVSRTVLSSNGNSRVITTGRDSSIAYDPHGHRFVNSDAPPAVAAATKNTPASASAVIANDPATPSSEARTVAPPTAAIAGAAATPHEASTQTSSNARTQTPPPARTINTPPPASHASGNSGSHSSPSHSGGGGSSHPSGGTSSPHSYSPPPSHSSPAPSGGRPR